MVRDVESDRSWKLVLKTLRNSTACCEIKQIKQYFKKANMEVKLRVKKQWK